MSWGADVLGVTEDTFSMIKSATAGIQYSTGIAGVDLQPLVSLVPVDTPFRNSNPRVPCPQGAKYAFWRSLLNINQTQPNAAVPFDQAGPVITIEEQTVFAVFAPLAAGGSVTQDALAEGQNYATVLAVDTLQTLNQLLISDDINQLGAINFALPAASTPTLTTAATGGSIVTPTTVHVKVAARSGNNYYYGGSQKASTGASVTVGTTSSTNTVTASVTAVKCAVAYDWFVGSSATTLYYYTTTTVNTVTITSVPTANQAVPSLPLISKTAPTAVPTTDKSFETYWQCGLLGSILADFTTTAGGASYVTPGTGKSQGAYYKSLDGAQLTVSGSAVTQLDELNQQLYDSYQLSPTRYLMAAQSINDLSNVLLSTPQAVTYLQPTSEGRSNGVLGGYAGTYLNKTVNGRPIALELQPHLPPGKIIAVVDSIPFPGANIDTVLSVETQLDYWRFDYGANRVANTTGGGPRYDFEVRSIQAFRNKAGAVMGVLDNIAAGLS